VGVAQQLGMAAAHLDVAKREQTVAPRPIPALSLVGPAVKATTPAQADGAAAPRGRAIPMAESAAQQDTIALLAIFVSL
jgi:hypothetical protein